MSIIELASVAVLVVVLLALGTFFAWRQVKTWRGLSARPELSDMERSYLRGQSRRRMACSILMMVLAFFFVGWIFLSRELAQVTPPGPEETREHPLVRTFAYYWIGFLLVLFVLLSLAAIDLVATLRHGFRSARLLESQGRAELAEELSNYRRKRAEMN